MQCPRCQFENSSTDAKFCVECGTRMNAICSKCETGLPAGAKFCPECGEPTTTSGTAEPRFKSPDAYIPKHLADRILATKSTLEGERKQVTVLFADIKGSTELIADLDPEEADKLLNPALDHMMEAVHHYEGTVTRVAGDGIMALFGAPLAHEDHAIRACYAALAMQEAMRQYSEQVRREHGVAIQVRVGLNSGEVVVRSIGNDLYMEYTAMGQTAHLAARMEQLAEPGCVLLPANTLRLVEGYMEVEDLGKVPVKGLTDPINVYQLRGAGRARRRFEVAAGRGLTRFVGRETELESIHNAQEIVARGHGQMLAVVGEAAVGKSRLLFEFAHSQRVTSWLVLQSSSHSYGKTTPFLPVIELLKIYFQIESRDDARTVREKMSGKLVTLDESLMSTLPALLQLFDITVNNVHWLALDSGQRRQRTFDAFKQLLIRESLVQPLVLIFEDLHWIDSKTQAFLDGFIDSLPTARILLLVNYRPEYEHTWASRTYYTQLRIDPLTPESAEELLTALLGNDAGLKPLKKLLIEQTQGNPFFLEESVRSLVETGALSGEPGAYRLVIAVPDIRVPATVQAVLAARIDGLPANDKHLLQISSVVGETIPFVLLECLVEMSADELRQGLSRLQAVEFLYETSLFPDLEYGFKHALTYQVAYNSLLGDRRRDLHSRILNCMEEIYSDHLDQEIDRLAHHAFQGQVWPKAMTYLRKAGLKAEMRSAYREAVQCFENALTTLEHLPQNRELLEQALDLRFDLRTSLFPLGNLDGVLEHLQESERLSEQLGDPLRRAWVSVYMCHYLWVTGQSVKACELGHRAHSVAEPLGDFALNVTVNYYLGLACLSVGDYTGAIKYLRRNVESLQEQQSFERFGVAGFPAAMSRTYLAWALAERGEFSEAVDIGRQGVQLAEELGHAWSLVTASWGFASVFITRGEPERAVELLDRALSLAQEWYLAALIPAVMGSLGYAKIMSGQITDGLSMLQEATKSAEESGRLALHSLLLVYLGDALVAAKRIEDARSIAERVLALCRERGERGVEAMAHQLMGEVFSHLDSSQLDPSETHYRNALKLADELGMQPLKARCNFGIAEVHRLGGDLSKAKEKLTIAIDLFRDLEMHSWHRRSEARLHELY